MKENKGLMFGDASWILQAIEEHHPHLSVALAYSVKYELGFTQKVLPEGYLAGSLILDFHRQEISSN